MKTKQNLLLSISLDVLTTKRIEKKIFDELTIDWSFVIKADSLYYFYDPSEKIYEVASEEFKDIIVDILNHYHYNKPKKIKIHYKIKEDKVFLKILFK